MTCINDWWTKSLILITYSIVALCRGIQADFVLVHDFQDGPLPPLRLWNMMFDVSLFYQFCQRLENQSHLSHALMSLASSSDESWQRCDEVCSVPSACQQILSQSLWQNSCLGFPPCLCMFKDVLIFSSVKDKLVLTKLVTVLRTMSVPILNLDPGTLLETVAETITSASSS